MDNNFSYYMPTKIVYGNGELTNIDKYINGRKTLLVTSNGFIKRGLIIKVKELTGSIVEVVSDIKSHPQFIDLDAIYNDIKNIDFELIVAIGGGSVIDSAKYFISKHNKAISLISIPTTAGTGSEITPWATIWNMQEKKKYSISGNNLFSEIALYDCSLTLSVPKYITIQTALDALSHALESIWNKNANEITINYAIKSAKLIIDNIIPLSDNLYDLRYRDNIMKASMYAGLAFGHTQTAIAHAMSYYITAHKGVDHGVACSFTLPMLIDKIMGKYKFIDEAFVDIFGELSSKKLRDILEKLNISTRFSDYGVEYKDILDNIDNNRLKNSLIKVKDVK